MGNKDQIRFHYYKRSWLKQWSGGQISSYNYKTKEYTKAASVRNSFTLDVYPQLHNLYHEVEKNLDTYDSNISKVVSGIEKKSGDDLKEYMIKNEDFIKKYMNLMVYRQPWMALLESGGFDPLNNEIESSLHAIRLAGVFKLSTHYLGVQSRKKFEKRMAYDSQVVFVKTTNPLPLFNTPMLNRSVKGLGKMYMMPATPHLLLCLVKERKDKIDRKLKKAILDIYLGTQYDDYPVNEVYHSKDVLPDMVHELEKVSKKFLIPEYEELNNTMII